MIFGIDMINRSYNKVSVGVNTAKVIRVVPLILSENSDVVFVEY